MRLLVGLGNPGSEHVGNRHNVGFMVLQEIARRHGFSPWRRRFQGLAAEGLLVSFGVMLIRNSPPVPGSTFVVKSGVDDVTSRFVTDASLPVLATIVLAAGDSLGCQKTIPGCNSSSCGMKTVKCNWLAGCAGSSVVTVIIFC